MKDYNQQLTDAVALWEILEDTYESNISIVAKSHPIRARILAVVAKADEPISQRQIIKKIKPGAQRMEIHINKLIKSRILTKQLYKTGESNKIQLAPKFKQAIALYNI